MGNAATCKACGSGKAVNTTGSDSDLSEYPDYYRTADLTGCSLDSSLVSSREGDMVY